MKVETKESLEATINACAKKATDTKVSIAALQYTQAAVNAANALSCLIDVELREKKP